VHSFRGTNRKIFSLATNCPKRWKISQRAAPLTERLISPLAPVSHLPPPTVWHADRLQQQLGPRYRPLRCPVQSLWPRGPFGGPRAMPPRTLQGPGPSMTFPQKSGFPPPSARSSGPVVQLNIAAGIGARDNPHVPRPFTEWTGHNGSRKLGALNLPGLLGRPGHVRKAMGTVGP